MARSAYVVGVNLFFYVIVAAGLNNAIIKIPADIAIENWQNWQKSGKTGIIAESGEITNSYGTKSVPALKSDSSRLRKKYQFQDGLLWTPY